VAVWPFFRSAARVVLLAAAALGCQGRPAMSPPNPNGGPDGGSDAATLQSLRISVTGCATFDLTNMICYGSAPLTVSFAPVGSSAFTNFLWHFGDQSPDSMERAPMHTFTLPSGSPPYDVIVTGQVGEMGGTVASRPTQVIVMSLPAGAACDVDKQCGQGLQCLCQVGSGCGPAFARGICTTTCATGFCGTGSICAQIALGPSAGDGGSAAPLPLCLADCSGSSTCGPGFVCQQMPAGPGGPTWVSGCLPVGAKNDFGVSCRDANGVLRDGACTTGTCADIGALGMCTATCDSAHPCPANGACARLPGGADLCLPACSTAAPCTSDPGLTCTAPADAGADGGLTLAGATAGIAYCAPI
jgi:hypothetical protein